MDFANTFVLVFIINWQVNYLFFFIECAAHTLIRLRSSHFTNDGLNIILGNEIIYFAVDLLLKLLTKDLKALKASNVFVPEEKELFDLSEIFHLFYMKLVSGVHFCLNVLFF